MADEVFDEFDSTINRKKKRRKKRKYLYMFGNVLLKNAGATFASALNIMDGQCLELGERVENWAKALGKNTFLGKLLMSVVNIKKEQQMELDAERKIRAEHAARKKLGKEAVAS